MRCSVSLKISRPTIFSLRQRATESFGPSRSSNQNFTQQFSQRASQNILRVYHTTIKENNYLPEAPSTFYSATATGLLQSKMFCRATEQTTKIPLFGTWFHPPLDTPPQFEQAHARIDHEHKVNCNSTFNVSISASTSAVAR